VVQAGTLAGDQILSGNALTYYNNGNGNYGATGNVYLPTTPANGDMVVINKASGWGITVYAGSTVVGNLGSPGVNSGGQDNLYFKWDTTKGQWLTGTNALIKVGTAAVTTSGTGQSTWTLTDNTGLGNSDSVLYVAQIENTAGTFGPQSTPGVYDWRYNVDNVAPASITLIGTDDVAPVTGTIAANSVTNDDKPTFSGTTEGNAVVKVYDGVTLLGTTTANGVGAWSFTPTTAMAPGLHSVTATATDAYGNTTAPTTALPFTIDIAAPVAVADVNSGNEDVASLSGTVATNDTSKDGSETYAIVGSATGAKGSLVLNPNGSYTYTRTSAADEITVDLVETFTYKVTDAAGNTTQSTLKITLTPVNDAAIIGGQLSQSLTETNAVQSTSGTLTISDVDSAATFIEQVNTAGTYGKLGLTAAGVWSYTMNSAQNQFVASQVYTDTFNVMATDGTTKQVSVNITGTNDAPVNTLPGTQSTAENTAKYITGLQIADPDVGIGNMTMTLAVTNGVLFLTGSGISFVGNNSASVQVTGSLADLNNLLSDPLAVRFTPTTNFNGTAALTITTSDGSLSDVDTLNILVSSVNYAPVNTVPAAQTVSEDSDVTNLANVAAGQTAKASVSGGGGFDTLGLTGGASLNLSTISNAGAMGLEENSRIEGIERIAMGADTAANTLTLTARDVKDMAGFNLFHTGTLSADGKTWTNVTGTALSATTKFHQLLVDGSSNDSLVFAPDLGFWTNVGTVSNGSLTYTVYQNAGTSTQVLARSVIPVTNNDSVAPVVLDLNRDGQLDYSQTLMDVNNDGQLDQTAWAGRQDGVLVWDKYADGWVHDNSQYAFSQYGGVSSTDLQGLAAAFDSNRDGVLNAQDAKFGEFKVWQDGNGNGVSEVGEVRSLTDVGIEAIELSSDSVVRAPAVGVQEAGRSTAQLSGGGEMLVADAAFAYQSVPELDLAGFVAQTQASAAKAQPLSAQTSVKLFLYDMIQSAHAAEQGSEALFAAEGDTLRAPEPQHLGYHMDLLAEHLLQQPQS
jgi:VCBS repeat-containing protein